MGPREPAARRWPYLPFVLVVLLAPEPGRARGAPRTLREAVWGPFVGFLGKHRAFEILAFVVLYKLSDQLTQALTRPFLVQVGFGDFDVGRGHDDDRPGERPSLGTFLGGYLTQSLGLGPRSLDLRTPAALFEPRLCRGGEVGLNRPLMYAAQGFEHLSSGLGTGAFGVLLLRLTEKRFSATQYALLSSLFTIPRILAGPVAGVSADAFGWRDFFIRPSSWASRASPCSRASRRGERGSCRFEVAPPSRRPPLSKRGLAARGILGALVWGALAAIALAALNSLAEYRTKKAFALLPELSRLASPASFAGWSTLFGLLVVAAIGGLVVVAAAKARRAPQE